MCEEKGPGTNKSAGQVEEVEEMEQVTQELGDEEESNLIKHAKQELELVGYRFDGSDDPMNEQMAENILELIQTFAKQGHSGFSAPYCLETARKLMLYEPLKPLTGEDWEWVDVSEAAGETLYQNKRCSRVFKDGQGDAFDIEGYIFREPSGVTYTAHGTDRDSKRYIESFPYTPEQTIIDVEEDSEEEMTDG